MRRKPSKDLRMLAFDNNRQYTSTPKPAPHQHDSITMTTAESPIPPRKPSRRTVQFDVAPSPSNSIVSVHALAVRQDDCSFLCQFFANKSQISASLLVRSARRSRSASPENDRRRTRVHFAEQIVQIDQTFDSINEVREFA